MDNCDEKEVLFRKEGFKGVSDMLFHVTDNSDLSASVARIVSSGSFIQNNRSRMRILFCREAEDFHH